MHDTLFENQKRLFPTDLRAHAADLGLDLPKFETCLAGTTAKKVASDIESGKALSVAGTPAFLIGVREANGQIRIVQRLSGAQGVEAFEQAIQKASGER